MTPVFAAGNDSIENAVGIRIPRRRPFHELSTGSAHLLPPLGFGVQQLQIRNETRYVANGKNETRLTVDDAFRAPDVIAHDDRQRRRHRFEDDERVRILDRR